MIRLCLRAINALTGPSPTIHNILIQVQGQTRFLSLIVVTFPFLMTLLSIHQVATDNIHSHILILPLSTITFALLDDNGLVGQQFPRAQLLRDGQIFRGSLLHQSRLRVVTEGRFDRLDHVWTVKDRASPL